MNLRYEISAADFVALSLFDFEHSPFLRRRVFLRRVILAAAMVIFALGFYLLVPHFSLLLLGAALAVGAAYVYPLWLRRLTATRAAETYRDSRNLGEYEMRISDVGLAVTNPIGSSSVRWDGIDALFLTDTHAFVYLGARSAYIIPRAGVVEGDYDAFIEALQGGIERERTDAS